LDHTLVAIVQIPPVVTRNSESRRKRNGAAFQKWRISLPLTKRAMIEAEMTLSKTRSRYNGGGYGSALVRRYRLQKETAAGEAKTSKASASRATDNTACVLFSSGRLLSTTMP